MAVKFRRIEDRADSVIERRESERARRQRFRLLPKLAILVLLAGAALVLYLRFAPPRLVGPFEVQVEAAEIAAPVEGRLVWLLPPIADRVEAGQTVARISTGPAAGGSPAARLADLRLRAEAAGAGAATEAAARSALAADLDDKQRRLQAEVSRIEVEVRQATQAQEETARRLQTRVRDAEDAERLARLGAATEHDRRAAREAAAVARAADEEARGRTRSLRQELISARAALDQFETTRRLSLAAADSRVREARLAHEALAAAAAAGDEAFADGSNEYVLRAPFAGRVLEVLAVQGSHVRQGAPLLKVYAGGTKRARAYVAERLKRGLREGAAARLYVSGRDEPFLCQVARVHARMEPLPGDLSDRLGFHETDVVPVDIALSAEAAEQLVPGQIGRAVIEK